MKLFGLKDGEDDAKSLELSEIAFTGHSAAVRTVAEFLLRSADRMDEHGDRFGHDHLRDEDVDWPAHFPDVVVARPQS